jgi:3-oxoacyl-[acyl-carrier-protein] synthase-3
MYINDIKSYFPDEVVDNKYFAEKLDTSEEWITSRVGIKERRRCREDNPSVFVGTQAVHQLPKEALAHLDCIMVGTSVTQWQFPSTANFIAKELNIDDVPCFDLKAACSSFLFGLRVSQGLLATGFQKILLILPEVFSGILDYTDRSSAILLGDGAVACLVSNEARGFEVIDLFIDSKSSGAYSIRAPIGGYFFQEGSKVQNFAVRYSIKASQKLLKRNNLTGPVSNHVDYLILHQANFEMMKTVVDNLGLKREQLLHNIERYGNTGAVGAPSVLAENWDKIKPGEKVMITVVGSGLSWGSLLLEKILQK